MVQKKQENNTNTVGAGKPPAPTERVERAMRDVAGAISEMEKMKIEKRKAEAYQLAQAIYSWVLSENANTKGKAFIEQKIDIKPSFTMAVAQGFAFALGFAGYLALTNFISWALKFLHL